MNCWEGGGRPASAWGWVPAGASPRLGSWEGAGGHQSSPGGERGLLCQGLNRGAGVLGGVWRSTVAQYFLLKPWLQRLVRGTPGSPASPRAAAGLASVSNVLCLPAMLCQYIFRAGGGSSPPRPQPGPQRAG